MILKVGYFFAAILVLAIAGFIYEHVSEKHDAQKFTPPGKLVDIDGYKLHLHCTGSGKPTVVIESGWGDFSSSWGWVQPEVAKTTRVCTYDRAGMGWSESSPEPRTAKEFSKELHALLLKANEPGPYLMVGHSLGGYTVRVFAHDYADEVAGLIFVDAQNLPASQVLNFQPAPKPGESSFLVFLSRLGVARLLPGLFGSIRNLPESDKWAYRALSVSPRSVQAFLDEGRGMSEGGAQAKGVTSLGSLPLIVLSRGKEQEDVWAASQKEYLSLSKNGQQLFADQSGHNIMIEQPKAIIDAINLMIAKIR